MIELIAVLGLLGVLVCQPWSFADQPAGEEPPAAEPPPEGQAGDSLGQPPADPDEQIVDQALAEPADAPPPETPPGQLLPAPPEGPPGIQLPDGSQAQPQEILDKLGVSTEGIPPELQRPLAELASDLYLKTFAPMAQQYHDQLQGYYGQLQEFVAAPAYQIGAQLAEDPRLLDAVNQFLAPRATGPEGAGQAPEQQPKLNLDELDPDVRNVYDQLTGQISQLQEQLGQATEQIGGVGQWAEQQQQSADQMRQEQDTAVSLEFIQQVTGDEAKRLGLDPRQFAPQYQKAWQYVENCLGGLVARTQAARQAGQPLAGAPADVRGLLQQCREWFREGITAAGMDQLATQRRQQAQTTARAPGGRQPSGGRTDPDERIVDEALAAAGYEG